MITLPTPGSTDEPIAHRLVLDADAGAPGLARHFVEERLGDFAQATLDDALLLVSEVVTNAVRYGSGQIVLTLAAEAPLIQVDVHDEGAGRPPMEATRPADSEAHGRGLLIVEAIATDWGIAPDREGVGKTVWFELLS